MTKDEFRLMRHRIVLTAQFARQAGDPCELISAGLPMWEAAAHVAEMRAFAAAFKAFRDQALEFLRSTNDGRFLAARPPASTSRE